MCQPGRSGCFEKRIRVRCNLLLKINRTAEQSEGNKAVGVDPTVITARKNERLMMFQSSQISDMP